MLPLIQDSVCAKKNWLSDEEFLDIISIVNSIPGMLATNVAGFVGYRCRGVKGFLVAIAGCITPSIIMILILATVFTQVSDNTYVQAFFQGVRPCIVVIMINAVIKLAKKVDFKQIYNIIAVIVAFVAIAFFSVPALYMVILAVVVSLIIFAAKAKKTVEEAGHDS